MRKYIPQLFLLVVVAYLLFLIRPALLGQLGGTFKGHQVPQEYVTLEKFLNSQDTFSRTFWLPTTQRFGFYSSTHPAIPAFDYYHVSSISGVLDNLKKDSAERQLQEASVKYVIVPFDSEGELFLKDRKYDEATYEKIVADVQKISWLSEINGFGRIHVFEIKNSKDHFWTDSSMRLSYREISPVEFSVKVENAQRGDRIVFAESYDSGWKGVIGNKTIGSKPFEKMLNSFVLPQGGSYSFNVIYNPQQWVNKGIILSAVTLIISLGLLVFSGYSWFGKRKMVE